MNWFLLIAGDNFYPEADTRDWIGCFPTFDAARAQVTNIDHKRTITKGAKKGQEEVTHTSHSINGREYDWFDIVDLRDWVTGNGNG
jgi:hypothetical protein